MKTKNNDDSMGTRPDAAQPQTRSSEIDRLAQEIFAQLNDDTGPKTVGDLELQLSQAVSALVPPSGAARAVLHASLLELPSKQRETLLLHLGGLTCAQIARSQRRTHDATLKDLSRAYARLRFSLELTDQPAGIKAASTRKN